MSKKLKRELDGTLAKLPDTVAKDSKFKNVSSKLAKKLGGKGNFFAELETMIKELPKAKKLVKGNKAEEASIAKVEACLVDGKKKHLSFKTKSNRPK